MSPGSSPAFKCDLSDRGVALLAVRRSVMDPV